MTHIRLSDTELAVLDTVDFYRIGYLITRINVPMAHRSQGYGTILMERAIDKADRDGKALFAEVSSYNDGGLTNDQLAAWLRGFGFEKIDTNFWARFTCGNAPPSFADLEEIADARRW